MTKTTANSGFASAGRDEQNFSSSNAIQQQFLQTKRTKAFEKVLYFSSVIGFNYGLDDIKCPAGRKAVERYRQFMHRFNNQLQCTYKKLIP